MHFDFCFNLTINSETRKMSTKKIATTKLHYLKIKNFTTQSGAFINQINLSYQLYGKALGAAPIILINHALTGNSNVTGKNGWWKEIIGISKVIDTTIYTVIAFNVPGNGFDQKQKNLMNNYQDFTARDISSVFGMGLQQLKITSLYAIIGGSVGGGIAWELAALYPKLTNHLICIASDWKSTDWLIANCYLQNNILNNSSQPLKDARIHAMLCYRTPTSFKTKFNRTTNKNLEVFNIESWLAHHGNKLQERFELSAYKLMNQLLKTIDITKHRGSFKKVVKPITANIHIIGVNSDLFFTANENKETYNILKEQHKKVHYYEIDSIHGHDAFLIEYHQLSKILNPIFSKQIKNVA